MFHHELMARAQVGVGVAMQDCHVGPLPETTRHRIAPTLSPQSVRSEASAMGVEKRWRGAELDPLPTPEPNVWGSLDQWDHQTRDWIGTRNPRLRDLG